MKERNGCMAYMSWPQWLKAGNVLQFNRKTRTVMIVRANGVPLGVGPDDERTFFFMRKHGHFARYVRMVAAHHGCETQFAPAPQGLMAYELVSPRRKTKVR